MEPVALSTKLKGNKRGRLGADAGDEGHFKLSESKAVPAIQSELVFKA